MYGAIPGGTIIGPVLEVRIVNNLEEYGLEILIPSIFNPIETSYVVISRETERFVDQIHDHKKELRSSDELLTAFQKSEGKESCMEGGSNRIEETCAPQGNKETCANPFSNSHR